MVANDTMHGQVHGLTNGFSTGQTTANGSNSMNDDASMPIAIIGVGGRFPGEATNPEKLWDMISKGRTALSEVPKDRFNIDAFYHPHAERQGTMNVRGGHFLKDDISAFDAPFFSITPAEASAMDPQQRLALEVAYEGLENGMKTSKSIFVGHSSLMTFSRTSYRRYCGHINGLLYGFFHTRLCQSSLP